MNRHVGHSGHRTRTFRSFDLQKKVLVIIDISAALGSADELESQNRLTMVFQAKPRGHKIYKTHNEKNRPRCDSEYYIYYKNK